MQLTFLRGLLACCRAARHAMLPHRLIQNTIRVGLLILVAYQYGVPFGFAADAVCLTYTPAVSVRVPVALAPNRTIPGSAYPSLIRAQIPGYTMTCTGAPANQRFWIGAREIQPGHGSTAKSVQPAYISPTEVRATLDDNHPGHQLKIGNAPPPGDWNADSLYVGGRAIAPGLISCSGASGSARIGDAIDSKGGGVAYLSCSTNADGSLWVTRSSSIVEVYQASPDGAVGVIGDNLPDSDSIQAITLSPDAGSGITPVSASSGILVSLAYDQIKSIMNTNNPASTTPCSGPRGSWSNPLFKSVCSTVLPTWGSIYFGNQPDSPAVCDVSIASGQTIAWTNPINKEQFSGVGMPIAPAEKTHLDVRCTGGGVSSLNNITVLSRGAASPADATAFASSNPSVNYRVTAGTRETTLAPNSNLTFGAADGVIYTQGAGAATASLPLSITPIAALPNPIPGRADTRVTLEVYAGL